jgi:hypothetical protein
MYARQLQAKAIINSLFSFSPSSAKLADVMIERLDYDNDIHCSNTPEPT